MKHSLLFVAFLALGTASPLSSVALAAGPDKVTRDFETDAVGAPPSGFEFARTGGGAEGKWVVRVEKGTDKNHVVVQESADPTDYRFPVAVLKEGAYKDVTLRRPASSPGRTNANTRRPWWRATWTMMWAAAPKPGEADAPQIESLRGPHSKAAHDIDAGQALRLCVEIEQAGRELGLAYVACSRVLLAAVEPQEVPISQVL